MIVSAFFIINKSGGLIYKFVRENKDNTDENEKVPAYKSMDLNSYMVMNSTLHTIHQMASIIYGESQKFFINMQNTVISMYKTMTGYTFVFIGDDKVNDKMIKSIYNEFNMYVLRNPVYINDMPINLKMFRPFRYF